MGNGECNRKEIFEDVEDEWTLQPPNKGLSWHAGFTGLLSMGHAAEIASWHCLPMSEMETIRTTQQCTARSEWSKMICCTFQAVKGTKHSGTNA
jgi:hypothetical protein